MDNWKTLDNAPLGETIRTLRGTNKAGNPVYEEVHVPVIIIAQSNIGEVIPSFYIPPAGKEGGRWNGFTAKNPPVLWQELPKPRLH